MSDDMIVNHTSHCTMCAEETENRKDIRNYVRFHLAGTGGGPAVAICTRHDMAGHPSSLPKSFRLALGVE